MGRYRKKPVEIDATQFTGYNGPDFIDADITLVHPPGASPFLKINTLEGTMTATEGDWIITGINGERYPCRDDIFRKTYEAVDES